MALRGSSLPTDPAKVLIAAEAAHLHHQETTTRKKKKVAVKISRRQSQETNTDDQEKKKTNVIATLTLDDGHFATWTRFGIVLLGPVDEIFLVAEEVLGTQDLFVLLAITKGMRWSETLKAIDLAAR